jgi:hypothetical protein
MAQIAALGEREILSVVVDQTHYTDEGIDKIYCPSDKIPFWDISLKDGTTIYATGNVILHFR